MNLHTVSPQDRRSPEVLANISREFESWDAHEIVRWAHAQFPSGLMLASSFGAEDMVLIDLLTQVTTAPVVFYLDTGLLFPETYQLIDQVEQRYGFRTERVTPRLTVDEQGAQYGDALWSRHPDQCCGIRKVEPLRRYLSDKEAWITGIRRDQTPTRKHAPIVGFDDRHNLVKINPLARWTFDDVFQYLAAHDVPYNPLHDQGYPSIGCIPCTRPVNPGDDARSGRWAGQEKTECGLHL